MIKVGDMIVPKLNPEAKPSKVIEIKDMGHGKGNERVKVELFPWLHPKFYSMSELQEVVSS